MEKVQSVYEIKVVIKYTATNAFRVITFVVAVFGLIQQYSREIWGCVQAIPAAV